MEEEQPHPLPEPEQVCPNPRDVPQQEMRVALHLLYIYFHMAALSTTPAGSETSASLCIHGKSFGRFGIFSAAWALCQAWI